MTYTLIVESDFHQGTHQNQRVQGSNVTWYAELVKCDCVVIFPAGAKRPKAFFQQHSWVLEIEHRCDLVFESPPTLCHMKNRVIKLITPYHYQVWFYNDYPLAAKYAVAASQRLAHLIASNECRVTLDCMNRRNAC